MYVCVCLYVCKLICICSLFGRNLLLLVYSIYRPAPIIGKAFYLKMALTHIIYTRYTFPAPIIGKAFYLKMALTHIIYTRYTFPAPIIGKAFCLKMALALSIITLCRVFVVCFSNNTIYITVLYCTVYPTHPNNMFYS
jgi:hypothetical protein